MSKKSVGDLTPLEIEKLRSAQFELKNAAMTLVIFTTFSQEGNWGANELFVAARRFDAVCHEIGFDDYWKEE